MNNSREIQVQERKRGWRIIFIFYCIDIYCILICIIFIISSVRLLLAISNDMCTIRLVGVSFIHRIIHIFIPCNTHFIHNHRDCVKQNKK